MKKDLNPIGLSEKSTPNAAIGFAGRGHPYHHLRGSRTASPADGPLHAAGNLTTGEYAIPSDPSICLCLVGMAVGQYSLLILVCGGGPRLPPQKGTNVGLTPSLNACFA